MPASEFFLPRYRILDLTDATGAFAGKLLADLGAEVIKVEPPAGDPSRWRPPFFRDQASAETSLDFLAFNTNKRSLSLDIAHSRGRDWFLRLLRTADALVENFLPGELEAQGLSWRALHEANAHLVWVSITPYGASGPRSGYLASDIVSLATSGFMQVTGDPDGPPMRLGNEQSRFPGALYAALGTVAALFYRDWHGIGGQHIDISMQEALLSFYLEQHPVLCWNVRKKNVVRVGPVSSLSVPAGVFPCADGWVGIGIFTDREWDVLAQWLYEVTGREEILAQELRGGIHARAPHRDLIEAVLLDFTLRQTRAELFREGQRRNLVVVPVNTIADLLADPALAEANFWKTLEHPVVGPLRYPLNLLGPEVATASRAAPQLGEANEEILCRELGMSAAEFESLRAAGVIGPAPGSAGDGARALPYQAQRRGAGYLAEPPPCRDAPWVALLEGVRVVEFGPFIALPLTGRILAALGATVIKVESNKVPDQLAFVPPWGRGMGQPEYQALKRRITLDVRTPEGAAILRRLLGIADVFLTNFRRDALARWGLDLEQLRREYPRLIVVLQSGFGSGPYERYKLYGIMAQHICGVSTMSGQPEDPPCCLNSAYSDYHTPLFQALAVLVALHRRRETGMGMGIEGSIFRSGVSTVATALLDYQAGARLPARRGNHDPIAVPHNAYPCKGEDEWCALAVWTEPQWRALCRVLGHPDWAEDDRFRTAERRRAHEGELDRAIAAATCTWEKHALMDALQRAGVPAGIVAKGEDLASDPQLASRALYRPTAYFVADPKRPGIEWERGPDVLAARLPLVFSETPCLFGPYRRIGEDNAYVFGELLRMSRDEIDELTARGVLQ